MSAVLVVPAADVAALRTIRDRDPKPWRRERAAALLKIAAGATPTAVARAGLHRPRDPETVNRWVRAFAAHGLASLTRRPSRRAFSP